MYSFLVTILLVGCGDDGPKGQPSPPPKPIRLEDDKSPADKAKTDKAAGDHAGHGAHGKHDANKPFDVGEIPANAKVYFVGLKDGDAVKSPLKVKMGVDGMTVEPATNGINPLKGHHHIIIDTKSPAKGTVIPADEQHLHFGKGQTETELKLPLGKHTLRLQFANGAHISYGPKLSTQVTITVSK